MRGTRLARYRDEDGLLRYTLIPEGAPETHAPMGIPVGPPSLDALELPPEIAARLHNELAERELLTAADCRRRPNEVVAALMATLRIDAGRILQAYMEAEAAVVVDGRV